jgi:hypothetical protein
MKVYIASSSNAIKSRCWYKPADLAELVGIPAARLIRRAVRQDSIPYIERGCSTLILGQTIIAFLEAQGVRHE